MLVGRWGRQCHVIKQNLTMLTKTGNIFITIELLCTYFIWTMRIRANISQAATWSHEVSWKRRSGGIADSIHPSPPSAAVWGAKGINLMVLLLRGFIIFKISPVPKRNFFYKSEKKQFTWNMFSSLPRNTLNNSLFLNQSNKPTRYIESGSRG